LQSSCLLGSGNFFAHQREVTAAPPDDVTSNGKTFSFVALFTATVVLASLACGGAGESVNPVGASPAARAPVQVRVMTFNIQHGIDGTDRYNLQRAIDTIARVRPDIVGLQEVTRNHPYYACDDQPARLAAGLQAATGERWDVSYQQEWFTPDVSCRGDGPETEGLVLLSRRSMAAPAMMALPDSRIGLATSLPDSYRLPIAVTHLSSGSAKAATRAQQIDRLLAWFGGFGEPRILIGDFNAAPEAAEMRAVTSAYRDAWTEAERQGRAIGTPFGRRSTRIDYIFYLPATNVTLQSAEFIETTALIGVEASDHKPLVATFLVR
jgi:endonuclease/exonuclease/phosphatase family metal-dependent hydrolase